jgi:hypothetical protein
LHRLQTPQLFHHEEQEDEDRKDGIEEVLSVLPQAHRSQRIEVNGPFHRSENRAGE